MWEYPTQPGQATLPHLPGVTGCREGCQIVRAKREKCLSIFYIQCAHCCIETTSCLLFGGASQEMGTPRFWTPISLTDTLLSFSALAKQESVFTSRRKTLEHNRNFKVKTEEPLEWGTSRVKQMLNKGFQDHSSGFKHLNSFWVSDQIPKSFFRPKPVLLKLCPLVSSPTEVMGGEGAFCTAALATRTPAISCLQWGQCALSQQRWLTVYSDL